MILLLGGTTEGRIIAGVLQERGYPLLVSVVSGVGRDFLPPDVAVRSGPFSEESLEIFIRKERIQIIVDATHPFAQRIKAIARQVAQKLKIPYLVYERTNIELPPSVLQVNGVEEAIQHLRSYRRIFFTIGSKYLAPFMVLKKEGKSIRVRVLPMSHSLRRCEELGLSPRELVALCGPVSAELNYVLFREFGAEVVVSKESGREGGLPEKVEATSRLGIPLLLLKRPCEENGERFGELDALLARLHELYGF